MPRPPSPSPHRCRTRSVTPTPHWRSRKSIPASLNVIDPGLRGRLIGARVSLVYITPESNYLAPSWAAPWGAPVTRSGALNVALNETRAMGFNRDTIRSKAFSLLVVPLLALTAVWAYVAVTSVAEATGLLRSGERYAAYLQPVEALRDALRRRTPPQRHLAPRRTRERQERPVPAPGRDRPGAGRLPRGDRQPGSGHAADHDPAAAGPARRARRPCAARSTEACRRR